jgi:subtilisin family serine protease
MNRNHQRFWDAAPLRASFPLLALGFFALTDFALSGCNTEGSSEPTARHSEALKATNGANFTNGANSMDALKAASAAAQTKPSAPATNTVKDQYIVVFKKGATRAAANAAPGAQATADVPSDLGQRYGGKLRRRFRRAIEGMSVEMSAASVEALRADPRVDYVVENGPVTLHDITWGRDRIDQRQLPLNQTFNAPNHGEGVHAYIIDTGILATHTEFQGGPGGASRIGQGVDIINGDNDPEDSRGHGTHVAGIVGGTRYGVANQVTLYPVKVFGTQDQTTTHEILIAAIEWVMDHHQANPAPAVINMSLGGGLNAALNASVQSAIDDGITLVASAGNAGNAPIQSDSCTFSPASAPNAITVSASDLYDARPSFSSYGPCIDLFAPGSRVLSAWFTGDAEFIRLDGTSMSGPHVAGAVALYLSANPSATPAQVTSALVGKATRGVISDAGAKSPNRLLYVGNLLTNGGDSQAPVVQITAPAAGGTVSGITTVSVTASDNLGVKGVELYVDGAFESDDSSPPYALSWNTVPFSNGPHDLTVYAYDEAGNRGTGTVRPQLVQDTALPVVTITSPASGASVGAVTTLRATATDAAGVRLANFTIDGNGVGGMPKPLAVSNTFEVTWDSRSVTPGTHTLVVQALDGQGTWGSSSVDFTVFTDGVSPTAALTAPANGATVTGTVLLTATASDDRGVISEVNFLAGEQVVCTDTAAPYECSWNTRPEGNGAVTLRVKASDRFGNVAVSAPRTVTVQNSPVASYNVGLQAPACTSAGPSCSSRRLADGQLSTEPHPPNTLGGSCADGLSLGRYHFDESIDRLYITTLDGTNLAPGKRVSVETKTYLLGDVDSIDLYYAPDANAPSWTYITTLHRSGAVHDIVSLTAEFNLAATGGSLQAIRANLRVFGAPSPCSPGEWNDRDDLVFAVGAGPCTGLCSNPVVFSTAGYNSQNLGTSATCHQTTANPVQFNCGNFASGRTFRVNNRLVTCNNQNVALSTIGKRNGGYCFQASAGNYDWAYFATF